MLAPAALAERPAESVVSPASSGIQQLDVVGSCKPPTEVTLFSLPDAIAFARQNSPRLRSARAAIQRAEGQEQVAFAPYLPELDLFTRYGGSNANLSPGAPSLTGSIEATAFQTHNFAQAELQLQWTLYDFGRTGGRYHQSVARARLAELQLERAEQTLAFDVVAAYMDVLLARASRRVQEEAIRQAEAILGDSRNRLQAGEVQRDAVLRAEVQVSESREALVRAEEAEFDSLARLNRVMGRNASLPLQIIDLEATPGAHLVLPELLEQAAAQRPEVGFARQAVAASQYGWEAARGEFFPRLYILASLGDVAGGNVRTGTQEGAGIHLNQPLFAGGRHLGELHAAEAEVTAAVADAQNLLDGISLEVNLAYRGAIASAERIELSRTAITQATENLRLVRSRYRQGDATPTDIVDAETALTRSQQRFYSASYDYLTALARVDYAIGREAGAFVQENGGCAERREAEELPAPREVPKEAK
jgi:outer membrane protein TolC